MARSDSAQMLELLAWFTASDGKLHDSVEIHWFDNFGGWGFRAKREIGHEDRVLQKSDEIVSCPYKVSLSYLNAFGLSVDSIFSRRNSPQFPPAFLDLKNNDSEGAVIIGNFFLIQQFLMGKDSFWYPYIRLLPQPDQPQRLGTAYLWPEDDLKFLKGTNAEPAIGKRKMLWSKGWQTGFNCLKGKHENWEAYTYELYQWAAAVFCTRSFRPSLILPASWSQVDNSGKDDFSMLLPVLDLGNHSYQSAGVVEWRPNDAYNRVDFCYIPHIEAGQQIFNNYGYKTNSELLIGYGFILPEDVNEDTVNIKVMPNPEARRLRCAQKCYVPDPELPLEEVTYTIHSTPLNRDDGRLEYLRVFSDGLIDTLGAMLANRRETKFLEDNEATCPEKMNNPFKGPLCRNFLQLLFILYAKLESELARYHNTGAELGVPINYNQELALQYRNRQMKVIKKAMAPIHNHIEHVLYMSSFMSRLARQAPSGASHNNSWVCSLGSSVEILSLESAYDWLSIEYPSVFAVAEDAIAEDQEEAKPLNWVALIEGEGWEHTFWSLWIYIVWMLRQGVGSQEFNARHRVLGPWLDTLPSKHPTITTDTRTSFYGETHEEQTFDLMTSRINTCLPMLSTRTVKTFASYVAREEIIQVEYPMFRGEKKGDRVMQKVLVVAKEWAVEAAEAVEIEVGVSSSLGL